MGLPARSEDFDAAPLPPLRLVGHRAQRESRRTLASRRSRRIVLSVILLFTLGQVTLGLYLALRHPGKSDWDYWTRIERVRQRAGAGAGSPLKIFVLGTSRTQVGLRAGQLEDVLCDAIHRPVVAVTFSAAGCGPLTELFLWRRLQRDGVRPDVMLIEVHPALLNARIDPGHELSESTWPVTRLSWSDLAFVERYAGCARPGLHREWI
jgi:hypothetical protein